MTVRWRALMKRRNKGHGGRRCSLAAFISPARPPPGPSRVPRGHRPPPAASCPGMQSRGLCGETNRVRARRGWAAPSQPRAASGGRRDFDDGVRPRKRAACGCADAARGVSQRRPRRRLLGDVCTAHARCVGLLSALASCLEFPKIWKTLVPDVLDPLIQDLVLPDVDAIDEVALYGLPRACLAQLLREEE